MTNRELQMIENQMTIEQLKERADLLIKSGFLPAAIKTPEQALTIILTGRELGLGFMESLRSINVIQGKPCLSSQLMVALCQRTGELEDITVDESKPDRCQVTVKRKGKSPHAYTFSIDDAKALGLLSRPNWVSQPRTMLRWRALSGNLRVSFADAICGVYIIDEAEDMIADKIAKEEKISEATVTAVEEMTPNTGEIHDVLSESELGLELQSYMIQDTEHFKLYQDRTIGEIYLDKTPSGKPKGKQYLERVVKGSSSSEDRAKVTRFLELMEKTL